MPATAANHAPAVVVVVVLATCSMLELLLGGLRCTYQQ
jgi:hypothetical protein